jgi:hypothetical protein
MILIYVEIKKELEIKPVDFELSMPVQYHFSQSQSFLQFKAILSQSLNYPIYE